MIKNDVTEKCWLRSSMLKRCYLFLPLFFIACCFSLFTQANTSLLYGSGDSQINQDFLPVEQAFIFTGLIEHNNAHINVEVAPKHYLYKHSFSFNPVTESTSLGEPAFPQGEKVFDPFYQKHLETFPENFSITIPVSHSNVMPEIEIEFQGCAEAGLCYPPHKVRVPLITTNITTTENRYDEVLPAKQITPVLEPGDTFYKTQLEQQILAALLLFFIAGIGLSFTPCVLPMFPILSSLILGHQQLSRRRVLSLSLSYIISMSLTFAIAGTLMGLFGASLNLQAKLQSPWFIVPMAGLFMVLALSMFGLYELQLPSSIRDRLNTNNSEGGTISGAMVMGIISALVVSPCVSAPLAGALIYISTTGDAIYGGLILFTLGLGMGLPLLLLALGGRQLLPKAGNWMNSIKTFFGVLLLGVSVWMLERVIPAPASLFLWGTLAIGCAIFLGALDFTPKTGLKQTSQIIGLTLLVYGGCLIVGSAMGNYDPLKPLASNSPIKANQNISPASQLPFTKVTSLAELNNLLDEAAYNNQPAMVDVYADWCISCKTMERNVFPDPLVASDLQQLSLIKLDITKNTSEHKDFLNKYQLFGPPALLFFDPLGNEVEHIRTQGDISAGQLKTRLNRFRDSF